MTISKITPDVVRKALDLRAKGCGVREIAERLGVGKSQLASALAAMDRMAPPPAMASPPPPPPPKVAKVTKLRLAPPPVAPPPPPPSSPAPPVAQGTPLAIARDLLRGLTDGLVGIDPDSPAYVRLSGEARQCAKLIASLEREAAGEETAEEVERRRRREDRETQREIERYVDQALGIALRPCAEAPHGRCPTCAVALTAEGRASLTGGG